MSGVPQSQPEPEKGGEPGQTQPQAPKPTDDPSATKNTSAAESSAAGDAQPPPSAAAGGEDPPGESAATEGGTAGDVPAVAATTEKAAEENGAPASGRPGDADATAQEKNGQGGTTDVVMGEAAPAASTTTPAGEDGGGAGASSGEAPATGDGDKDKDVRQKEEGVGGGGGQPPKVTTRPGPALPPPLDDIQMVSVSGVTTDDGGVGDKSRHLVEIDCDGFTPEQLARLPVAFAYRLNDGGESERAAIAAQDDWYRRRRMERDELAMARGRAAATAEKKTTTQKKKPAPHKKSVSAKPDATGRVRPYEIESIPAPDAPPGWIRKTFNRKSGDHTDKYWFTPKTSKRLRSKTEVQRFIQYLEETGGDEDDAFDLLKNKPVGTTRRKSK